MGRKVTKMKHLSQNIEKLRPEKWDKTSDDEWKMKSWKTKNVKVILELVEVKICLNSYQNDHFNNF